MRTTEQVSPEAMRSLERWIPDNLRIEAWKAAYKCFLRRAPTTGGEHRKFAEERANRFWPNFLPSP